MSKKRTHEEFIASNGVVEGDVVTPAAKRVKTSAADAASADAPAERAPVVPSFYDIALSYIHDYRNGKISEEQMVQNIFKLPSTKEDFKQAEGGESILYYAIDVDSPMLVRVLTKLKGVSPREIYEDDIYAFQVLPMEPKNYKRIFMILKSVDPSLDINMQTVGGDSLATYTAEYGTLEAWKYILQHFDNLELMHHVSSTSKNAIIGALTNDMCVEDNLKYLTEVLKYPHYTKALRATMEGGTTLFDLVALNADEIIPAHFSKTALTLLEVGVPLRRKFLPSSFVPDAEEFAPHRKFLQGLEAGQKNWTELERIFLLEVAEAERLKQGEGLQSV